MSDKNQKQQRGPRAAGVAVLALAGALFAGPVLAAEFSVYKSPWCGCCSAWIEEMEGVGHTATITDVEDLDSIKRLAGVPGPLQACHTAIVEGYVIEGHVPASDIERLLAERPDVLGLSVPGMPMGAPGMGGEPEPFDVLLFKTDGTTSVYARY